MIGEYGGAAARPRKTLRRILLVLVAVLLILIVVRAIGVVEALAPLPIGRVQIFGTSSLSKREVLELAGLDAHTSILAFNKQRAKRSILGDPRVSGAEIVKLFPDTVRIYVVEKERKSVLIVGGPKDPARSGDPPPREKAYWLSRDGVVLAEVSESERAGYSGPLITLGSNNDDIRIGGRTGDYLLESVLRALGGIESRYPGFFRRIKNVSIGRDGVRVRLEDDRYSIYLGESASEEKFEQLRALLLVLESREVRGNGSGGGAAEAGSVEIDMSSSQAAIGKRE